MSPKRKRVAIIDYGMGNIFSVKLACEHVGLEAILTNQPSEMEAADALILPGVGAFGDAMQALKEQEMTATIRKMAKSGKPFLGICLGMQLMMTRSFEFGEHEGLNLLSGEVVRLENGSLDSHVKVPQVGWNRIEKVKEKETPLLRGIPQGTFMYFVHSYYVQPEASSWVQTITPYGKQSFCSSLHHENIFACQFHPERSGPEGLKIYRNFKEICLLDSPDKG